MGTSMGLRIERLGSWKPDACSGDISGSKRKRNHALVRDFLTSVPWNSMFCLAVSAFCFGCNLGCILIFHKNWREKTRVEQFTNLILKVRRFAPDAKTMCYCKPRSAQSWSSVFVKLWVYYWLIGIFLFNE